MRFLEQWYMVNAQEVVFLTAIVLVRQRILYHIGGARCSWTILFLLQIDSNSNTEHYPSLHKRHTLHELAFNLCPSLSAPITKILSSVLLIPKTTIIQCLGNALLFAFIYIILNPHTILWGKSLPHFTGQEAGTQRLNNLPKVIRLKAAELRFKPKAIRLHSSFLPQARPALNVDAMY